MLADPRRSQPAETVRVSRRLRAGQVPRALDAGPADAGVVVPQEHSDQPGLQRNPDAYRNGLLAPLALWTDHGPAAIGAASYNWVMLALHVSCLR